MSRFDHIYRSLILTKFFTKGWGNPENLKRLLDFRKKISNREICKTLVSSHYPIHIDSEKEEKHYIIQEGHFKSPFVEHLPGVMPKEVETAKFQVILPKTWPGKIKPMCLQLAGTGDHYFGRRRMLLAKPLLKEAGIGSILLENPYYGYRKPKQQTRSSLQNVSDLFVMGGALVLESLALLHWCERQGFGPLGMTGISMGGHMASAAATNWHKPLSLVPCLSWSTASCIFTQMASLAATNWHKPLSLVPCLSWSTASAVFLQGVMSGAIPWEVLHEQYRKDSTYEEEITKLIVSPEDIAKNLPFLMGRQFVKDYPHSLNNMVNYQHDYVPHGATEQQAGAKEQQTQAPDHSDTSASHHTHHVIHSKPRNKELVPNTINTPNARFHTGTAKYDAETAASKGTVSNDSKTTSKGKKGKTNIHKEYKITAVLKNSLQWSRSKKPAKEDISQEAVDFMRGIMDECTHLGNFSCPVDTDLIIIVQAKKDAYVPRENVLSLSDIWPGAEVRYVDWGHIGAFLFKQDVFRTAIIDSFDRQARKYYNTTIV